MMCVRMRGGDVLTAFLLVGGPSGDTERGGNVVGGTGGRAT